VGLLDEALDEVGVGLAELFQALVLVLEGLELRRY
jgi:hypothetical protein